MNAQENPAPSVPSEPPKEPQVHEGVHEGSVYRIEIYREPEEL